ncbi:MAG: hypothetical protein KDD33_10540 [Bdellovibrionales bacterium]|nr:hypothetical protein [Bdellovibrionales bacterium]
MGKIIFSISIGFAFLFTPEARAEALACRFSPNQYFQLKRGDLVGTMAKPLKELSRGCEKIKNNFEDYSQFNNEYLKTCNSLCYKHDGGYGPDRCQIECQASHKVASQIAKAFFDGMEEGIRRCNASSASSDQDNLSNH